MRVALDGSFLQLPPSGTGVYLRALLDGLREIEPALDLHVLEPDWHHDQYARVGNVRAPWNDRRVQRAFWELVGVRRVADEIGPDLLHIPHFSAPIMARQPLVVTIHDVIPLILPEYRASRAMRAHLTIVRRTVQHARLVLTPSRAAARDIERVLGCSVDRIRVTPEAAGKDYVPATDNSVMMRARQRLGFDGRYVFNVGGLDVRKNVPVLLAAFARMMAKVSDPVRLVIAGAAHSDNPVVFPPLEPEIERLGLTGTVLLLGRISDEDKKLLYQAADLYVTPSLYEGFGLTVLEAMASGVPVIAANRTSLPEVVGDAGLLVEPEPDALANAMVRIWSTPTLAAELRARGLARACEFSWRRTAELTLEAYHEALTTRANGKDKKGETRGG